MHGTESKFVSFLPPVQCSAVQCSAVQCSAGTPGSHIKIFGPNEIYVLMITKIKSLEGQPRETVRLAGHESTMAIDDGWPADGCSRAAVRQKEV